MITVPPDVLSATAASGYPTGSWGVPALLLHVLDSKHIFETVGF
jgi:hypothetical protein